MILLRSLLAALIHGIALSGLIPLAPHLERLPLLLVAIAFLWGVMAERSGRWMGGKSATILAMAGAAWYLSQVSRHNLATPMVSIAVLLMAVRFVTAKSPRNYLQIIAISLFCLAASSLYGLSPGFLAYLMAQLLLTPPALVLLTFLGRDPEIRIAKSDLGPLLRTSLAIPLGTVPLMIFFFFILPRTQFPLWNILASTGSERAGVSDTLQPGDKSSVSTGRGVVFRATMEKLPPGALYWRCMVLNSYDGRSWKRITPPSESVPLPTSGLTEQTIFLEPGQTIFYPGLDLPVQLGTVRGTRSADNLFQPYSRGGTRLKYRMHSALELPPQMRQKMKIDRGFYTSLPDGLPPRLVQSGRELSRGAATDLEKIERLEKLFLGSRLQYGTSGLPTGAGAMEDFLFTTKKGHCELFASTFALLLRLSGVPARLVGGYLGGEYSSVGGYYLVTEGRAHVWVEAWIDGSGWQRIDPSRLTEGFAEVAERGGRSLQSPLAAYIDALNYYWNSAVINYDLEKQFSLATSAGSNLRQLTLPRVKMRELIPYASAALIIFGVIMLLRRPRLSAEERIILRLRRLLRKRYGVEISPGCGLQSAIAPLKEAELDRFAEIYSAVVYRDCTLSDGELKELRAILAGLEKKEKGGTDEG